MPARRKSNTINQTEALLPSGAIALRKDAAVAVDNFFPRLTNVSLEDAVMPGFYFDEWVKYQERLTSVWKIRPFHPK